MAPASSVPVHARGHTAGQVLVRVPLLVRVHRLACLSQRRCLLVSGSSSTPRRRSSGNQQQTARALVEGDISTALVPVESPESRLNDADEASCSYATILVPHVVLAIHDTSAEIQDIIEKAVRRCAVLAAMDAEGNSDQANAKAEAKLLYFQTLQRTRGDIDDEQASSSMTTSTSKASSSSRDDDATIDDDDDASLRQARMFVHALLVYGTLGGMALLFINRLRFGAPRRRGPDLRLQAKSAAAELEPKTGKNDQTEDGKYSNLAAVEYAPPPTYTAFQFAVSSGAVPSSPHAFRAALTRRLGDLADTMQGWRYKQDDSVDRLRTLLLDKTMSSSSSATEASKLPADSLMGAAAADVVCAVGVDRADVAAEMANSAMPFVRSQHAATAMQAQAADARASAKKKEMGGALGLACRIAFTDPSVKPSSFVRAPFVKMMYWRTMVVLSSMLTLTVTSMVYFLFFPVLAKVNITAELNALSPSMPNWMAQGANLVFCLLRFCFELILSMVQVTEVIRLLDALFVWRRNSASETSVFRSQTASELLSEGGRAFEQARAAELQTLRELSASAKFRAQATDESKERLSNQIAKLEEALSNIEKRREAMSAKSVAGQRRADDTPQTSIDLTFLAAIAAIFAAAPWIMSTCGSTFNSLYPARRAPTAAATATPPARSTATTATTPTSSTTTTKRVASSSTYALGAVTPEQFDKANLISLPELGKLISVGAASHATYVPTAQMLYTRIRPPTFYAHHPSDTATMPVYTNNRAPIDVDPDAASSAIAWFDDAVRLGQLPKGRTWFAIEGVASSASHSMIPAGDTTGEMRQSYKHARTGCAILPSLAQKSRYNLYAEKHLKKGAGSGYVVRQVPVWIPGGKADLHLAGEMNDGRSTKSLVHSIPPQAQEDGSTVYTWVTGAGHFKDFLPPGSKSSKHYERAKGSGLFGSSSSHARGDGGGGGGSIVGGFGGGGGYIVSTLLTPEAASAGLALTPGAHGAGQFGQFDDATSWLRILQQRGVDVQIDTSQRALEMASTSLNKMPLQRRGTLATVFDVFCQTVSLVIAIVLLTSIIRMIRGPAGGGGLGLGQDTPGGSRTLRTRSRQDQGGGDGATGARRSSAAPFWSYVRLFLMDLKSVIAAGSGLRAKDARRLISSSPRNNLASAVRPSSSSGGGGGVAITGTPAEDGSVPLTRLCDVAGCEEAKAELAEVVDVLMAPERYRDLGARPPKGVLLVGPPGTGKTLLAKAVAGESDASFFYGSGSSFDEVFVGRGAARVRDLFAKARKHAPSVIFLDEIDAVGQKRSSGGGGGGGWETGSSQTLNQLLSEMDGFEGSVDAPVLVIAATNRPEVLDPALKRSGRFDREVAVSPPDAKGRALVLDVRARLSSMRFGRGCDFSEVVRRSWGYTGSDLERTLNEAGLLAARQRRDSVSRDDLLESLTRIIGGIARPSFQVSPFEKEVVARHEVGHALVSVVAAKAVDELNKTEDEDEDGSGSAKLDVADEEHGSVRRPMRRAAALQMVDKISIIPRGVGALGYSANLPPSDESGGLMTLREMKSSLCTCMGGRAAEAACYGRGGVTNGSSDDLQKATNLAQALIGQYGLGEGTGPVALGVDPFGPSGMTPIASAAAEECRALLTRAEEAAMASVVENRALFETLVKLLREREEVEGEELRGCFQDVKVPVEMMRFLSSSSSSSNSDEKQKKKQGPQSD